MILIRWLSHNMILVIKHAIRLALIKNEIVMNIEKMNIPPRPYRCRVRRPVRSISGIEASVITTCE